MGRKLRAYSRWGSVMLAALLPVVILGMYSLHTATKSLQKAAQDENEGVAAIAGESLRQHLQRSMQIGQVIASFPSFSLAVQQRDVEQARQRLRRLVEASPDVDRAFVLDPQGTLWCDWPVAPEVLNQSFAHRDYYQGVRETWQSYVSEVFQRQAAPRPLVIAVAVPVRDMEGQVTGILVFQHRLETITGWLKRINRGRGSEVVVLDPRGVVAGHSRVALQETRHEEYSRVPAVQEALHGWGMRLDYDDPLSGQRMMATLQPVSIGEGRRWLVIGQQDRAEAMAPVAELRMHIVLAVAVVAATVIGGAVALARTGERNRAMSVQLADHNARLEHAIAAERTAHEELKKAQGQLVQSEKMASLGQMVAGIAHEINNPLSFVSNNVAVLQRDLLSLRGLLELYRQGEADLRQVNATLLQAIEELSQRMDVAYALSNLDDLLNRSREGLRRIEQIVKDLRSFARLDESLVSEADLNSGVESTVNIVRGRARKKDVDIELALCDLPPITCSPVRLNQVVMNLLSNAIDACSSGGKVTVRSWSESDAVCVAVSDNGPGIAPEIRGRIFDPFFTTKPQGEGVGLGLSISYGIAREHGGTIEVESTPGAGATFTLRVPIRPPGTPKG